MAVRERVLSHMKTVYTVVKAEPSLALSLLCLFRYKPSREVGTFHENPSRLRAHGVQRCVHLPYVPPAALALALAGEHGEQLHGEGPHSARGCFGTKSELISLAF